MESEEEDVVMEREPSFPYAKYYLGDKYSDNYNEEDEYGWAKNKMTKIMVYFWYLVLEFLILDYINNKQYLGGYNGKTFHKAMHGEGIYNWTINGKDNTTATYEGRFYDNEFNGYGTMSYCEGSVYSGLYKNDSRLGPGVESQVCLSANVGLWSGNKLIRLAWAPEAVIPNLTTMENGNDLVNKHRIKLVENKERLKNNDNLEELVEEPEETKIIVIDHDIVGVKIDISDNKHAFNYKELFDKAYYEDVKVSLVEYKNNSDYKLNDESVGEDIENIYYAWNNSETMLDIMRHCYEHYYQIPDFELNLSEVLSGPRAKMKAPGVHELDSRILLMASYLGHIATVAELVCKKSVHPNVADMLGNTALMYAVFSDKIELIDFLIEAGAHINDVNDSCCSALIITLIRYLAVKRDISIHNIISALVPTEKHVYTDAIIKDWKLNRKLETIIPKSSTKIINANKSAKKSNHRIEVSEEDSKLDQCNIDKRLYAHILEEYKNNVKEIINDGGNMESIFHCSNLIEEINFYNDVVKKTNGNVKKINQHVIVSPKKMDEEAEKIKNERLYHIKQVVKYLLMNGADPNKEGPLPTLLIALAANSVDLVKLLLKYGADLHKTFPEVRNYNPLEIALSRPLSLYDNSSFCTIVALLKHGANVNRRMYYDEVDEEETPIDGPTLLHAVNAKVPENDSELHIQRKLLKVLLDYDCNAGAQFKERSVIDHVMARNIKLIDVFIKHPKVDLNIIINDHNETMLGKVFDCNYFKTLNRMQMFSLVYDLLKHGADPLLPYKYDDINYNNVITYAREKLTILMQAKDVKASGSKNNLMEVRNDYKEAIDIVTQNARNAYIKWIQCELVKELAVIVNRYIKSQPATFNTTELLHGVNCLNYLPPGAPWRQIVKLRPTWRSEISIHLSRWKHRSWHLIIKEHKRQKQLKVWLNTARCLEICNLLKNSNKIYKDKKVVNLLLCIVEYKCRHKLSKKITAREKSIIENEVNELLSDFCGASLNTKTQNFDKVQNNKLKSPEKDYIEKDVKELLKDFVKETWDFSWKKNFVLPELDTRKEKFNICFECMGPLYEDCIICSKCKVVSFCSRDCFKINTLNMDSHPCSSRLISQFSPIKNSMDLNEIGLV